MYEQFKYMEAALEQANIALKNKEIPVGAVLIDENNNIFQQHNRMKKLCNANSHAEILVCEEYLKKFKTTYLDKCTIFVTLEPCLMCMFYLLNLRIKNIVFGCYSNKNSFFEYKFNLDEYKATQIIGGVYERECQELMQQFFKKLR